MDMRRALKDRLAGYKIPLELKVLGEIPKNGMGKGEFFFIYLPGGGIFGRFANGVFWI